MATITGMSIHVCVYIMFSSNSLHEYRQSVNQSCIGDIVLSSGCSGLNLWAVSYSVFTIVCMYEIERGQYNYIRKMANGLNELLTNHISLYTLNWICCFIWRSLLSCTILCPLYTMLVLLCIMPRYCNV